MHPHSDPSHPLLRPTTKFWRCFLKAPELLSVCLLPDCYNVMLHWPSLPRGPLFPGGFRGLVVRSWCGITTGKVGTQHGPLAVPREWGQAIAASGILLVAGVIQVMLLRVLGARWHLAVGLGGDWPKCVAGGGQVVSSQPGGCRNGAVMDRADSFPGSATVAGLGVPNLWHGKTCLARSCILFFSMRENKSTVKQQSSRKATQGNCILQTGDSHRPPT